MTWDKLFPAGPIGSFAAYLLLAGCVILTGVATAAVLGRDRQRKLGIGMYVLSMVTVLNGLVAFIYTPGLITSHGKAAATQWAVANFVTILGTAFCAVLLGFILFDRKYFSLGFLWLGTAVVEGWVGATYAYHMTALMALAKGRIVPAPPPGWLQVAMLSVSGICLLVAIGLRIPRFRVGYQKPQAAGTHRFLEQRSMTYPHTGNRHITNLVATAASSEVFVRVPYGIPRWRSQQRRWLRVWWHEVWYYKLRPVLFYTAQFYGPPPPPDYKYRELEEFYP